MSNVVEVAESVEDLALAQCLPKADIDHIDNISIDFSD